MNNGKTRTPMPPAVADAVLFAADRTCCKCRIAGRVVQIHHIDNEPANNEPNNLAVLCLECHDETLVHGGFGRQLTANQIVQYRDDWSARVMKRRNEADRLAAEAMAATSQRKQTEVADGPPKIPDRIGLFALVSSLPELRRIAYRAAQPCWGGSTQEMVEGTWDVIRVFEASWASLAAYYPAGHFDQPTPRDYFSSVIAERARWHYLCVSTGGVGYSGTIVRVLTANAVLQEVERMLEEVVLALTGANLVSPDDIQINMDEWRRLWRAHIPDEGQ